MDFELQTYSEIVISVKNIDSVLSLYTETLGWEVIWRGQGDKSQINFWGLSYMNVNMNSSPTIPIWKYGGKTYQSICIGCL